MTGRTQPPDPSSKSERPMHPQALNQQVMAAQAALPEEVKRLGIALTGLITDQTSRLETALTGIRIALLPDDEKHHIPALVPVVSEAGSLTGWRVFCLACSDNAGGFVSRCERLEDGADWPPESFEIIDFADGRNTVIPIRDKR